MNFMKQKFQDLDLFGKIIKIMFCTVGVIGLIFTLIYIFYTAVIMLTSDSVITDVIAHLQVTDKQFILSNWYYGNEFWLFSLCIPTAIFSFFIKNNVILRQFCVLLTAISFFIILYQYGKKCLNKRTGTILVIIFLTGISYSLLDYFYSFNAYLTVTINSMVLLGLYYLSFEEKSHPKLYLILALIVTFLLNMGSLRYLPSVTAPFLLTEAVLWICDNKDNKFIKAIKKYDLKIVKILLVFIVTIFAYLAFAILGSTYNYVPRASSMSMNELSGDLVVKSIRAVIACINNFFGYDNKNHYYVYFMNTKQYFLDNHRVYSALSIDNIFNIVKIVMAILLLIFGLVILYKNYKKNNRALNLLLIFNTISWFLMIYLYTFTTSFEYHYLELKYFIFNIVLSVILGLCALYKYVATTKVKKYLIDCLIIVYIIANLYTTAITIKQNDAKVMKEKYELVNLLKKHKLTFGYGGFWNGLITHYLSDYKITVAACTFYQNIKPNHWYSDKRWYSKNHTGRVFLILDKAEIKYFTKYQTKYPSPDEILKCKGYVVYVYNKNPFLKRMQ